MIESEKSGAIHRVIPPFLALGLSFLAYGTSLSGRFVFDDIPLLVHERCFRAIGRIPEMFMLWQRGACQSRPLRYASFAVDHALFGMNPWGYHAINILLHACVTWLFFRVLERMGLARLVAASAAMLFCVHPIGTEAVAYISGRRDLLAALFSFAAILAHLPRPGGSRRFQPCLVALFSIGAFLSHEGAVALIGVLVLISLQRAVRGGEPWRRALVTSATKPSILLTCAGASLFAVFRVFAFSPSGRHTYYGGTLGAHVATALRVQLQYLHQLVWPFDLRADYGVGAFRISSGLAEPEALLALAVIAVIAAFGCFLVIQGRLSGVAILAYFGMLLPSSQIVIHHELAAEHRLYLPAAGLYACLAWSIAHVCSKRLHMQRLLIGALIFLLLVATRTRTHDWQSEETLWTATLKATPTSSRALSNLGAVFAERREYGRAAELFRRSIEIEPGACLNRRNLGHALYELGEFVEAEKALEEALSCHEHAVARAWLGRVQRKLGKIEAALASLRTATELDESDFSAWLDVASLEVELGHFDRARSAYERALKLPGPVRKKEAIRARLAELYMK